MKTIGEKIQKARKAKGLTLEEVQNITKIRQRYLEAIEEGNFAVIPGEVYIKGFIVNFANTVDLDGQAILGEYYQLKSEAEHPVSPVVNEPTPPKETPKKESAPKLTQKTAPPLQPKKATTPMKPLTLTAAIATVALVIGGITMFIHRPSTTKTETPVAAVVPITEDKTTPVQVIEQPKETKEAEVSMAELRLKATEKVWISLRDQGTGREIETVTLHPGDTREWAVDRPMVLRIGNGGGLLVSLRGEEFKTLGLTGEVVSVTYAPKEQN